MFEDGIEHLALGCGFANAIDSYGRVWAWGDNYGAQLGTKDDIHREEPVMHMNLVEHDIVQMSLGFQHALYLDSEGFTYAVGKNNRYQIGKRFNTDSENQEIFDKY